MDFAWESNSYFWELYLFDSASLCNHKLDFKKRRREDSAKLTMLNYVYLFISLPEYKKVQSILTDLFINKLHCVNNYFNCNIIYFTNISQHCPHRIFCHNKLLIWTKSNLIWKQVHWKNSHKFVEKNRKDPEELKMVKVRVLEYEFCGIPLICPQKTFHRFFLAMLLGHADVILCACMHYRIQFIF